MGDGAEWLGYIVFIEIIKDFLLLCVQEVVTHFILYVTI